MAEGRIVATNCPYDWERDTFVETVYHPTDMTARELDETIYELRFMAAKVPWVWKRTIRTLLKTRSLTSTIFVHGMNRGWKKLAKIQTPRDEERFGFTPNGRPRTKKIRKAFGMNLM